MVLRVGDQHGARAVDREPGGEAQLCRGSGPPSPRKPATPVPATVEILPSGADAADAVAFEFGDVEIAGRIDRDVARCQQRSLDRLAASGPDAFRPFPATVVMVPSGETRRTRWFPRSAM